MAAGSDGEVLRDMPSEGWVASDLRHLLPAKDLVDRQHLMHLILLFGTVHFIPQIPTRLGHLGSAS